MISNKERIMRIAVAFEIVMDLARENVIEPHYAEQDEALSEMREKQLEALDMVDYFFTNNMFD